MAWRETTNLVSLRENQRFSWQSIENLRIEPSPQPSPLGEGVNISSLRGVKGLSLRENRRFSWQSIVFLRQELAPIPTFPQQGRSISFNCKLFCAKIPFVNMNKISSYQLLLARFCKELYIYVTISQKTVTDKRKCGIYNMNGYNI